MVNLKVSLILLMWLQKSCKRSKPWGKITNVSPKYRSHNEGFFSTVSRASVPKYSMKILLTTGDRELTIGMSSFCWYNLSFTWKQVVIKYNSTNPLLHPPPKRNFSASVSSSHSLFLMLSRISSTGTSVKRLTTSRLTSISDSRTSTAENVLSFYSNFSLTNQWI